MLLQSLLGAMALVSARLMERGSSDLTLTILVQTSGGPPGLSEGLALSERAAVSATYSRQHQTCETRWAITNGSDVLRARTGRRLVMLATRRPLWLGRLVLALLSGIPAFLCLFGLLLSLLQHL